MAVQDWSITPAANTTIDGINIGENCPPENINDSIRAIMASVKVMYTGFTGTTTYAPIASPAFTGQPTVKDRGAMLVYRDAANGSGQVYVVNAGQSIPAGMQNGDILVELI